MVLNRIDENDLLVPLYAGVREQPGWATFLARLRRRTRADRAELLIRHKDVESGASLEFRSDAVGVVSRRLRFDPRAGEAFRPGRVYRGDELDDGEAQPLRVVRVDDPGSGLRAWTVISREREEFAAADGALLAALVPHLLAALGMFAALDDARLQEQIALDTLGRMGIGQVLLDGDATMVAADPLAERLLRERLGMRRVVGQRLHPATGSVGGALAGAMAALAARADAEPQVVRLSTAPPLAILLRRARSSVAIHPPTLVVGHVRTDEVRSAGRAAVIAALFGLPLSEARFADLLAGGVGIAGAGEALGLTIETARSYSKLLYAKTGTSGQADLVRRILESVAGLA